MVRLYRMALQRQRNDAVTLLGKRLLLAALMALVCFAGLGVWSTYQKERESAALRHEAEAQADDLVAREEQLKLDIADLESARGKEAALRREYALAGEGEQLIVIVNEKVQPVPAASSSAFVEWLHSTFPWW